MHLKEAIAAWLFCMALPLPITIREWFDNQVYTTVLGGQSRATDFGHMWSTLAQHRAQCIEALQDNNVGPTIRQLEQELEKKQRYPGMHQFYQRLLTVMQRAPSPEALQSNASKPGFLGLRRLFRSGTTMSEKPSKEIGMEVIPSAGPPVASPLRRSRSHFYPGAHPLTPHKYTQDTRFLTKATDQF